MRKMLAILATLAMLCSVLPLSAMFSAVADANVIEDTNFDDGEKHGWSSSSDLSVEDGVLVFSCTKDWANVYKYANGMKANTDYVYTFRAKANMSTTMNIKINDNWAADSASLIMTTFNNLMLLIVFISTNLFPERTRTGRKWALSCVLIIFILESTPIMHQAYKCGSKCLLTLL